MTYRTSKKQDIRERDFPEPGRNSMLVDTLAGTYLSKSSCFGIQIFLKGGKREDTLLFNQTA